MTGHDNSLLTEEKQMNYPERVEYFYIIEHVKSGIKYAGPKYSERSYCRR